MRLHKTVNGLSVHAIAGTRVVLFGLNQDAGSRAGCLGFAVQRQHPASGQSLWLQGMKTFQQVLPHPTAGQTFSSHDHPFQSYLWADYGAAPGERYDYAIFPLYGTPNALQQGPAVDLAVTTEREEGTTHSVYFNRGAAASQQYVREFHGLLPDAVPGNAAFDWLSRGLVEGLLHFIQRATGANYALHGAVYEFQLPLVLAEIRTAARNGAAVSIIYDAIPGASNPVDKNEQAIDDATLQAFVTPRTTGSIMHNKFLVLSRLGQPVAVWTGSTNMTVNGVYGHSNCGHVVEDAVVAADYLAYWQQLQANPPPGQQRSWLGPHNPVPPAPAAVTALFSPHAGPGALQWLADLAGAAQQGLFMTFPFGMAAPFQAVYEQDDDVLRFALLEKEGNGAGLAQGRIDMTRIRQRPNVVLAVGNYLKTNVFDNWVAEPDRVVEKLQVHWIHTKYLLVDPLGAAPVVAVGSANFSAASMNANDENLLVIRGDQRVADIYLTEFMRLHVHYAFRESVARWVQQGRPVTAWKPNYLVPDATWQDDSFIAGSPRSRRREYFKAP